MVETRNGLLATTSTKLAGQSRFLPKKEASDEGNKSFPACLAWEPGWFWVYSFVTQKCKIEIPDKGPHES
jgi:hypothetical protein